MLLLVGLLRSSPNSESHLFPKDEAPVLPPLEEHASILSRITFGWVDGILWAGYRNPDNLLDLWDIPLSDKPVVVLHKFQRFSGYNIRLIWRLLWHLSWSLLLQGFWALCAIVFIFVPVILLKLLLEYIEDPLHSSKNAAWLYVVLLLAFGCLKAIAESQASWVGIHSAVHLRIIIVKELLSKILRRTATDDYNRFTPKEEMRGEVNLTRSGKVKPEGNLPDRTSNAINLMSVDSFKIANVTTYLHFLWASIPVELILGVALLYHILGYAAIAGLGAMLILLPVKVLIARAFSKIQARLMVATDKRIEETNELFKNIRIIKYFVWEDRFLYNVDKARALELRRLRTRFVCWTLAVVLYNTTPLLITFFPFLVYTVVEEKDFKPSVAFPTLSLFALLRVPLDKVANALVNVQEAKVSTDRVEVYLNESETAKYTLPSTKNDCFAHDRILMHDVQAAWPSSDTDSFQLRNIDIEFIIGGLNFVVGASGSGKTALLMTLMGEMDMLNGFVKMPSFSNSHAEGHGSACDVSYCAQQAWLVNDTIRENIVFGSGFDMRRYKDVISACALIPDFRLLYNGDQTIVGDKGKTLSGGQRQRIALARALYSRASVVLLDDCLSSVDVRTGAWLMEKGICGPLMQNRTCILVSHNIEFASKHADHMVKLQDGKVDVQGPPDRLVDVDFVKIEDTFQAREGLVQDENHDIEVVDSVSKKVSLSAGRTEDDSVDIERAPPPAPDILKAPQQEIKANGATPWNLLYLYLRAMGRWCYWLLIFAFFFANQMSTLAIDLWIRQWANAYHERDTRSVSLYKLQSAYYFPLRLDGAHHRDSYRQSISTSSAHTSLSPRVDNKYYLVVYILIAIAFMFIKGIRMGTLFYGTLSASRFLHNQSLRAVTKARFAFHDSVSLGQVINRFSRDIDVID